jgi:uncharacterized beta-barrel protein YwiB (DUF1934 family)
VAENTDKQVIISITDSHETDGENSMSELITVGTMRGGGENYSLTYNEQDEALSGSVTTIQVEGNKCITMTRTGDMSAEMIIEKDKRHNCHYITPHGDFMMGVFAREINSKMGDNGGELKFEYTIDFNTGFVSVNTLKVTVKEAKGHVPLS